MVTIASIFVRAKSLMDAPDGASFLVMKSESFLFDTSYDDVNNGTSITNIRARL